MKISNWFSRVVMVAIIIYLGLHTRTQYMYEQRMNVLSCRIDLVNARIDVLRGEPAGDTTCVDALLKKGKAADLRSYDLYVPATKPL